MQLDIGKKAVSQSIPIVLIYQKAPLLRKAGQFPPMKLPKQNFVFWFQFHNRLFGIGLQMSIMCSVIRYQKLEPFYPKCFLSYPLVNQTCQIQQPLHFLKPQSCHNL